jgi:hypothetical protein
MGKSILDQLAHSKGRRDEVPNIELAELICKRSDQAAIQELVSLLQHKTLAIGYDAIKVLYEIGSREPGLIKGYSSDFLKLLSHKDNRMNWGAMTALSTISKSHPEELSDHLTTIVDAMDRGSVITRDHGIYILAHVAGMTSQHANCMELLFEQIEKSPVNQMPLYAEKTADVISPLYIQRLVKQIQSRTDVMGIPSKQKRLNKLLKSLSV